MPSRHHVARSNFASTANGVVHKPEEKLSIFGTTESDHKFGHVDCYTILYDHKNDSDQ